MRMGLEPIVLFLSDFDPSGLSMMDALSKKIEKISGNVVNHIEFKRIALTHEQIAEYRLPVNPDAIKVGDSRSKKHLERYGHLSVELDALHPETLKRIIVDALHQEFDVSLMAAECERERFDIEFVNGLRSAVAQCVTQYLSDFRQDFRQV